MAIEIVDFPINSMVIFHSYVKLPEGTSILGSFHVHYMALYGTYMFEFCLMILNIFIFIIFLDRWMFDFFVGLMMFDERFLTLGVEH